MSKNRIYARLGHSGSIFGMLLIDAVKQNDKIVVLSADMSSPAGLDRFKGMHTDKFFNVGIAEQNMLGVAAGMASEGYKVICVAQACFLSMRSFEQIRQYLGYMKSNVILVGINSGFALTFFGNTHYAIEDIAVIRTVPNITIIAPSDAQMAVKAFEAALKHDTPTYIRLAGGLNTTVVYDDELDYQTGRAIQLREGSDISIIATGTMVANAIQTREMLLNEDIHCSITDMHTIKPLDKEALKKCMSAKLVITIEEHSIIGGLGGAVAEYLSEQGNTPPLLRLGIQDKFLKPASYESLIKQSGLSSQDCFNSILEKYRSL